MRPSLSLVLTLLVASSAQADSFEEHDYVLSCSGCHRMDGAGSRVVPSLLGMKELVDKPGAREYWIRVPGAAQAPLSDARLADLMNWLVTRFTNESPRPLYTADEVGRLRQQPLRDPVAERRRISERRSLAE